MLENEIFCMIKTLNLAPTADYDLCLGPHQGPEDFPVQIIGPGMEKRKYPRLDVDLPMAYLISSPDSGKSSAGMAVLKSISQGGMFFKCPPPLPIDGGDIQDFTIDTIPIMRHISRLKVLGKVVRLEPPKENYLDFGIAVQFLSDLNIELRR
jgi:hypothetical protein